jgi:cyclopropane fatty-acyl-phospholipid synthase-like methyltransferase
MGSLPFSEACERNKDPILVVLREVFADRRKVLEIGSGTGQHAVHFAAGLSHLTWQPTELPDNLSAIQARRDEAGLANLLAPMALDVNQQQWPDIDVDAVFTANTLHIVSWPEVISIFERLGRLLPSGSVLAAYGPFRYDNSYTSESNAQFDLMLRSRNPSSGIRDFEALNELAAEHELICSGDWAMPANNRTLVWRKARA